MTAIQQITVVAASLGWEVKTDIQKKKRVEFEFQRYTKMGQDFFFTVGMKDNDTGSLISEIEDYYESFDPNYEAYLWIGTDGHGRSGAPYHIKDIVSDMEDAEAKIKTLYETLKTTFQ